MNKKEDLKKTLKFYIESKIPGSITHKAKFMTQKIDDFRITKGEVSKILNLRLLPSLDRIMKIEEAIGVDILLVNYPKTYNLQNTESENKESLYNTMTNEYGMQFERLIQDLERKFSFVEKSINHKFVLRKRRDYLSVNIVPNSKEIGGFHILFFRYNKRKQELVVQFIIPNIFFKEQIQLHKLTEGITETTYLPYKNAYPTKKYNKNGRPWLCIKNTNELNQTNIDAICNLALDVYNKQSS
jgi:transcriptional regulator with XRE-family HTH domain